MKKSNIGVLFFVTWMLIFNTASNASVCLLLCGDVNVNFDDILNVEGDLNFNFNINASLNILYNQISQSETRIINNFSGVIDENFHDLYISLIKTELDAAHSLANNEGKYEKASDAMTNACSRIKNSLGTSALPMFAMAASKHIAIYGKIVAAQTDSAERNKRLENLRNLAKDYAGYLSAHVDDYPGVMCPHTGGLAHQAVRHICVAERDADIDKVKEIMRELRAAWGETIIRQAHCRVFAHSIPQANVDGMVEKMKNGATEQGIMEYYSKWLSENGPHPESVPDDDDSAIKLAYDRILARGVSPDVLVGRHDSYNINGWKGLVMELFNSSEYDNRFGSIRVPGHGRESCQ